MLSYDSPVSVTGKPQPSPTNMTNMSSSRSAMPGSPKSVRHAPAAVVSNGVAPTGTALPNGHHHCPHERHHQIWLVTGPAGSGKSTVAKHLAARLGYPYIEGDEVGFRPLPPLQSSPPAFLTVDQFHPKANVDKMSAGIPLTDEDRWDWLTALRVESIRRIDAGNEGVVLTCSALKRKYRDVIRVAPYFHTGVHLHFIYLQGPESLLLQRVAAPQEPLYERQHGPQPVRHPGAAHA